MLRLVPVRWTIAIPLLALIPLALTWGTDPAPVVVVVVGLFLAGSVLAAVHHAEVVAHRAGEPFGSLVTALATVATLACSWPSSRNLPSSGCPSCRRPSAPD